MTFGTTLAILLPVTYTFFRLKLNIKKYASQPLAKTPDSPIKIIEIKCADGQTLQLWVHLMPFVQNRHKHLCRPKCIHPNDSFPRVSIKSISHFKDKQGSYEIIKIKKVGKRRLLFPFVSNQEENICLFRKKIS